VCPSILLIIYELAVEVKNNLKFITTFYVVKWIQSILFKFEKAILSPFLKFSFAFGYFIRLSKLNNKIIFSSHEEIDYLRYFIRSFSGSKPKIELEIIMVWNF